jgi:hypothetical protein
MPLLNNLRIAKVVSFVVVGVFIAWGVIAYRRHVQAENAFAFVRDLVTFSQTNGHLPASIQEFCQW